ncbi:cupin domain-containing protein [Sediminibacterium sp. C3]|uniref:cupin domain-containing protein n=1 Tax=Sediminibacterium sp. C3 TaxID=1267211 RepID=UPI0004200C1F|nr:cupin domain-containing protein [Sediminibacterium sp. C3]
MNAIIAAIIQSYKLLPHPEGGYYKETYRSVMELEGTHLQNGMKGKRNCSTAILFLLVQNSFSAFHRIKSDELWHFYDGDPVQIHVIEPNGNYHLIKLGKNALRNEVFQAVVPAGAWFASKTEGVYSLVGCTVAPGFDFADFELANGERLAAEFPDQKELIFAFCRH